MKYTKRIVSILDVYKRQGSLYLVGEIKDEIRRNYHD